MTDRFPATDGDVCIIGSLNADLVVRTQRHPKPGETVQGGPLRTTPGGKSANQAVAAARLGARVRMVGAVGEDPHGTLLLRSLDAQGVDTTRVRTLTTTATGTAVIIVSADGENSIVISPGANGEVTAEQVTPELFDGVGTLTLTFEIPAPTVLAAARAARAAGVTVVLNPSPFRLPEPELLACTDLLVVNAHEMGQLIGDETTDFGTVPAADWDVEGHRLFRATGVADAVVTLGAGGAVLLRTREDRTRQEWLSGYAVRALDTTGAGDAVTGTLAAALAAGTDLPEATALAMRVGAIATQSEGAQPSYPSREDLESLAAPNR
ncbi:ribokinase [Kocuria palustris]|uniref:ribokinase n=1 Tax=Kocuria palustris TaxID=71999 RepID=UPI0011A815BC|nr:ribokinase [Kocuria palustris]